MIEDDLIFSLGLLLLVGGALGWLAARLRLPRITGYICAGVLLSPSVLPLLDRNQVNELTTLGLVLLGVIGFAIGCSIRLKDLTGLGRAIAGITVIQGFLAWGLTIAILLPFGAALYVGMDGAAKADHVLPLAFLLGAIAWPTAPAVTIALIRELRCKGPVTTSTLSIVALSDVAAVVAFGLSLEIVRAMLDGQAFSWEIGVFLPLIKLVGSLALGGVLGLGLVLTSRFMPNKGPLALASSVGAILLCLWLSEQWGLSLILSTMTMGMVAANLRPEMGVAIEPVEGIVFLLFFVISSLFFEFEAVTDVWLLAILIVVGRCTGKFVGARLGAELTQAPAVLKANVGFLLLPKAGLTMGLAFIARDTLGDPYGGYLFNALLLSTLINMLFAPPLAKWALMQSGEAQAIDKNAQR
jgi:Kef-type K+ transport system membrane component KefB